MIIVMDLNTLRIDFFNYNLVLFAILPIMERRQTRIINDCNCYFFFSFFFFCFSVFALIYLRLMDLRRRHKLDSQDMVGYYRYWYVLLDWLKNIIGVKVDALRIFFCASKREPRIGLGMFNICLIFRSQNCNYIL